jgi:homoserine kinase
MRVRVKVPATSANLGPGFDCFGLALDLCNEVTVDTDAEPDVTWEGEGADELPTEGSDMVSRAIALTIERHPGGKPLPSFALHGVNRIPLERGLGSSSAAAVAGAAAAFALTVGRRDPIDRDPVLAAILGVATEIDGHPDNAASAVHGGFTITGGGVTQRLDPHPSLEPVVLVPEERLPTSDARRALPDPVPRADAVFNIGHAALTAIAITERPDLLRSSLRDRLHEEARATMMPASAALLNELRSRRVPACLSGAGPSILAFEGDGEEVGDVPDGWRILRPGLRSSGVEVRVEG